MFIESRLERLVQRVRERTEIPLRLSLWNGREYDFSAHPTVTVRVPRRNVLRYFLPPDLSSLGEAYVEGAISVEGPIEDVFAAGEGLVRHGRDRHRRGRLRFARHGRASDRRAIEHHYDVSNDFYRLFLDREMVYSCAYFAREDDTLERAQERKLDHILNKLCLQPGQRLLDIGCGWGGLVIRAAQRHGVRAVGITLSRNQHELALGRVRALGLEDRVEIRLQDYREVPETGGFDRISSVGMFEHVGLRNLGLYFRRMNELLAPGGLVLNHGITASDPASRWVGLGAGEFIDRYVFPQGELPHISLVLREMSAAGFEVADVESLRRHYALTCAEWARRIEARSDEAEKLAGSRRSRIWRIYLAGCAWGFRHGWMNIYQVLAGREGDVAALPMTRDWMYRTGSGAIAG